MLGELMMLLLALNSNLYECIPEKEVDPYGKYNANKTVLGGTSGGRFESAVYDDDFNFYVTEDSSDGALRRYTPRRNVIKKAMKSKNYWQILTRKGGDMKYLVLEPESTISGTFRWASDESEGRNSASKLYFNSEGIEYHNGLLFFIAKKNKILYTLNLSKGIYKSESTESGLFDGQPDQIKHIRHVVGRDQEIMYFTEDFRSSGIHAQDLTTGKFFTVVHSYTYTSETTGIAFSPDMRHFYFCFQSPGTCFDITRVVSFFKFYFILCSLKFNMRLT